MAKKKRVVRKTVVRQQKSWVGQKLAWLAAAFGVSIALLTAVTYRSLVQSPQVLETTPGTILREWNFDNPSEIGKNAWQGYVMAYADGTNIVSPENFIKPPGPNPSDPPKIKFPLILTVANGLMKMKSDAPMDITTILFNKNIDVDVTNLSTDVVVEVVMSGKFIDMRNPKEVVAENTAKLTVDFGNGKSLSQGSRVKLVEGVKVIYTFAFKRQAIGNGKIGLIQFSPVTTRWRILQQEAGIDRITILAK